jgi:hypothetical protein
MEPCEGWRHQQRWQQGPDAVCFASTFYTLRLGTPMCTTCVLDALGRPRRFPKVNLLVTMDQWWEGE